MVYNGSSIVYLEWLIHFIYGFLMTLWISLHITHSCEWITMDVSPWNAVFPIIVRHIFFSHFDAVAYNTFLRKQL